MAHFERAWLSYMEQWNLDGTRRIGRDYSTYWNAPLPRAEDKLLFILVCVKQASTQQVQGQLLGMTQSNANKWIHHLHPVLTQTLGMIANLPTQQARELARG